MIDMDGVIYAGEELIKDADRFVARMLKEKIDFIFLSNNSSRSRREAVEKLENVGVKGITEDHIYTSAMATAAFLKDEFPGCSAYVLGEGGLLKSLEHAGIRLVDRQPDFVILGEGYQFDLKMVHKAVDMIIAGARFITTNRDPSPRRGRLEQPRYRSYGRHDRGRQRPSCICDRETQPRHDALCQRLHGTLP